MSRLAFLGCLAGVAIVACAAQRGSAGSEPSPLATALPVVLPSASIAPASARSASVAPAPAPPASPTVDNELPPFTLEVYRNTRFDFSIGVPSFFTASPPPKNGFGQEWRWGDRATMTASGLHFGQATTQDLCAHETERSGVTARWLDQDTCTMSGSDGGRAFWELLFLKNETVYSIRFDYDEHLKGPFGAVIKQVNESWKIASTGTASRSRFRCPAGWIDECGECYQPCEYAGSDCRMEGQTCQAIVCSHAPHGTGCVRP